MKRTITIVLTLVFLGLALAACEGTGGSGSSTDEVVDENTSSGQGRASTSPEVAKTHKILP